MSIIEGEECAIMNELFQVTKIEGCYIFKSNFFYDHRGSFTKIYSEGLYKNLGLQFSIAEIFFSDSHKDVVRGMHFQIPPHDHAKVVTCIAGQILDVVLDLRKSSPTYGKAIGVELAPNLGRTLVIPRGCAHGFYSYQDHSIVCYAVETSHNKSSDAGVKWDSFGFSWPSLMPKISERDRQFPNFNDFISPFS